MSFLKQRGNLFLQRRSNNIKFKYLWTIKGANLKYHLYLAFPQYSKLSVHLVLLGSFSVLLVLEGNACIKWLEQKPWLCDNVLGRWTLSLCRNCQFFIELQVRNVISLMSSWCNQVQPFNVTTFFSQLNVLFSRGSDGFVFPSLTFSKHSPFISSVVSCSNLDTEKLSGWWDPLFICFTLLLFLIVSVTDPYFQTISRGEKATRSNSWAPLKETRLYLRRQLHICNRETRIAPFSSIQWKQGNRLLTPFYSNFLHY